MPGDSHRLLSNDKIVTDDQNMPDVVSVEYLNEVDVPGTPPHKLHLKLGLLISFIRNTRSISFDSGLVNGRKGVIRGISRHVLDIKVIADGSPLVKVPRTCFEVQVFNGHNVGHVLVVGNYFIVAEEGMAITWHFFQNVVVNIFYVLVCWC